MSSLSIWTRRRSPPDKSPTRVHCRSAVKHPDPQPNLLHRLADPLVRVDIGELLGQVGQPHGLAPDDRSVRVQPRAVRPGNHSPGQRRQQRGLAAAVHPDDPDSVPGAEPPGHLVNEATLAVAGADRQRNVLKVDHGLAQPGGGQPGQLDAVPGWRLGGDQRVGRVDPELRLGGPGPGPPLQPGELLTGQVAAAPFGGFLTALTFGLREHVGRVSAFAGVHLAPVDLPGPLADGVEQPAVVADHDDR
jgi:hypothetical protein